MVTSNSMPISTARNGQNPLPSPELIDRLATEMRASGDRELPHSFYVEQVKGKFAKDIAANDDKAQDTRVPAAATSSVFHCWALAGQD